MLIYSPAALRVVFLFATLGVASAMLASGCETIKVSVVEPCSMEKYRRYWEVSGTDKGGHDLDGLMSIFPGISGVQFQVRTLRAFGKDSVSCFENGVSTDCDPGNTVVPEFLFWCFDISECCGTTIAIEKSYQDTQGQVNAVATISFTSSGTATFRVEAFPARAWSPVSGTVQKM